MSHVILSNTFEYSMQLVNPKLTLPYWDFTIETSTSASQEYDPSKPETMSELLHESWFGSADPNDHMVSSCQGSVRDGGKYCTWGGGGCIHVR